jgi:tetraacyldisaccharide 4'-kinase
MREPAFWWQPPSWMSRVLAPIALIYGTISGRRMLQRGHRATVPVICVGNYTLGGAGKTPTVIALLKLLRAAGETPVVLSRGYGGQLAGPMRVDLKKHVAADVGDEPLLLAQVAPVIVSADRVAGADAARSASASVIVMDDGFQNPSLQKDVSLIVIDAGRAIGNTHVFPAGPLRAPLAAQLTRTDVLLVSTSPIACGAKAGSSWRRVSCPRRQRSRPCTIDRCSPLRGSAIRCASLRRFAPAASMSSRRARSTTIILLRPTKFAR